MAVIWCGVVCTWRGTCYLISGYLISSHLLLFPLPATFFICVASSKVALKRVWPQTILCEADQEVATRYKGSMRRSAYRRSHRIGQTLPGFPVD